MEALKAIKIIGNQNDGRACFYFFQVPGNVQRVLNFMRDPKLAHILVKYTVCWKTYAGRLDGLGSKSPTVLTFFNNFAAVFGFSIHFIGAVVSVSVKLKCPAVKSPGVSSFPHF